MEVHLCDISNSYVAQVPFNHRSVFKDFGTERASCCLLSCIAMGNESIYMSGMKRKGMTFGELQHLRACNFPSAFPRYIQWISSSADGRQIQQQQHAKVR